MRRSSRRASEEPQPLDFSLRPQSSSVSMLAGWIFLCICVLLPLLLIAQQSGAINGAVTDASGGAIPNASVTVNQRRAGNRYSRNQCPYLAARCEVCLLVRGQRGMVDQWSYRRR